MRLTKSGLFYTMAQALRNGDEGGRKGYVLRGSGGIGISKSPERKAGGEGEGEEAARSWEGGRG